MGIRVIEGTEAGTNSPYAVLFCSTTGAVIGKAISGTAEDAERFLRWYGLQDGGHIDLRRLPVQKQYQLIERWQSAGGPGAPEECDEQNDRHR